MPIKSPRRILIVDDDLSICQMMANLLRHAAKNETSTTRLARARLFNVEFKPESLPPPIDYDIEIANQGEDGYHLVRRATLSGKPFLMAFLDMRMPPGWDGLETMIKLWQEDPNLQIVLCTAYSDYSWEEILAKAGRRQNLQILKKPFEYAEAAQMALALTEKGLISRELDERMRSLESLVEERTAELSASNRRLRSENDEKEKARAEAAELLEKTLGATTQALLDMMAMGNPLAFSRSQRVKSLVSTMAGAMGFKSSWKFELAAMLSHLGCLTIPEGVLRRRLQGGSLSKEEEAMLEAYPALSRDIVAKIPRLEPVAAMMDFRDRRLTAAGFPSNLPEDVAGALMLRTAIDFDSMLFRDSKDAAIAKLREKPLEYPAQLLDLIERDFAPEGEQNPKAARKVPLSALLDGMELGENIVAKDGIVVAQKGQRLGGPLLRRIANFLEAGLLDSGKAISILAP